MRRWRRSGAIPMVVRAEWKCEAGIERPDGGRRLEVERELRTGQGERDGGRSDLCWVAVAMLVNLG